MEESYEPLVPVKPQLSPGPAVEFLFAKNDERNKPTADELREEEASWIANRIQSFLQDTTPCIPMRNPHTGQEELRRVQQGDIAILFSALSDIATYENALQRVGIDYYLVGGHAFFAQQEVYDIANLCMVLADENNSLSLMGILRSPLFNLNDETLMQLHISGVDSNKGEPGTREFCRPVFLRFDA